MTTESAKPPVAYTSELTPLEEAVATILPKWPEAYAAVLAYARELSGYVPPSDGTGEAQSGREGDGHGPVSKV